MVSKTARKNIEKNPSKRNDFEKLFRDEIENMRAFGKSKDANKIQKTESFMCLLLLAGTKNQNHTHFHELWTKDGTQSEVFRACMSYDRFLFLLAVVRFDS